MRNFPQGGLGKGKGGGEIKFGGGHGPGPFKSRKIGKKMAKRKQGT